MFYFILFAFAPIGRALNLMIFVSLFFRTCRMLEDASFQHVVSWNQAGDAFVVKVCISPDLNVPHILSLFLGYERIYEIYFTSNVQTLELC